MRTSGSPLLAVVLLAAGPAAEAAKPRPPSALEIPFESAAPVRLAGDRAVDAATGRPVALYRPRFQTDPGTPEEMARQYLRHAASALRIDSDFSDLEITAVRTGPSGTVVRFRQQVEGIPVYGPDLAVKLDRDGRVTHVASGYRPGLVPAVTEPALSADAARAVALDHLAVSGGVEWEHELLVVLPGARGARLAWQIDVVARPAPRGEWRVMVDAVTGELLGAEDRAFYVDGGATVFDPDPLSSAGATYGDPGYVDGDDADTAALGAARFSRTLRDITASGGIYRLAGPWAECVDWDTPFKGCFPRMSPAWNVTRSPDAFEAANVYYHIDTYMRYLNETLGLAIEPYQYPGGVQYDPHGFDGEDNSLYSSPSGRLTFGEGGVDDAEDADVVIHELGHGLHDWVTAGGLSRVEGLSEGVGDFAAAEYSRSFGHWEPGDPQHQWVFSWDGHNEFWPGRVTNWTDTRTYPAGLTGSSHTDGQFWSSCNMQVWDAIGRDATVTAHWEGLAMTNSGTNQLGAAQAVVQAAVDLGYDPADVDGIVATYQGCGYAVTGPSEPPFDDAAFVLMSPPPPATMYTGQTALVNVTMRNTGTTTWTTATGYKLGSQSPQDNTIWGFHRVPLSGPVDPGEETTFQFAFTAPSTPGTYGFQWRMLREGVAWFGAPTPHIVITVQKDAAAFSWQSVPNSMVAGRPYNVSVRMRNVGSTTWTPAAGHRLGSQNPQDNQTWGLHRVLLPGPVAPGGWATFDFTVVAPSGPGTYSFRWRMVREGVAWFGAETPNVAVNVQPLAAPSNLVAVYDAAAVRIRLSWADNSSNEDGFHAQFSYAGSGWSDLVPPTVAANVTTWQSAPNPPSGSYQFRVRALGGGAVSSWSNVAPLTFTAAPPFDDAAFAWQSVPAVMTAGQQYVASITMYNAGTTTWTAAAGHRLGSQNPQDNQIWGLGRVLLPWDVPPGGLATFSFFVDAPATPGTYGFQWRMLREGVSWFGAFTPNVAVVVQ